MRGVLHEMPFLRTADPDLNMQRGVQLAASLHDAREAASRYRAAILHHDDLAARLCAVFGYSRASVWNGHVPPRTDGFGAYNPSPYRAALVPLILEALERDDDWRTYDSDRLASVPERHIKAPWTEHTGTPPPTPGEAGLWHESAQ
jgi:hypothetical protein